MTILLDDHLLRDWIAGPDRALRRALGHHPLATTNLWYARLCKSAARASGGALLGDWAPAQRDAIIGGLVALSDDIDVVPMRDLVWRMGVLAAQHGGLSTLGSEVVAAAEVLGATVLVSARDVSPGVGRCCSALGIGHLALPR